eukprot:IDg13045t1
MRACAAAGDECALFSGTVHRGVNGGRAQTRSGLPVCGFHAGEDVSRTVCSMDATLYRRHLRGMYCTAHTVPTLAPCVRGWGAGCGRLGECTAWNCVRVCAVAWKRRAPMKAALAAIPCMCMFGVAWRWRSVRAVQCSARRRRSQVAGRPQLRLERVAARWRQWASSGQASKELAVTTCTRDAHSLTSGR